jgi:2-haloacid dehalogenase
MSEQELSEVKALTFDVFGTVVDWRGSIIRAMSAFGAERGLRADWAAFAEAWRALYQPTMERVRSGELPWTKLDVLHRMNLDQLLERFNLTGLSEDELDHINRVWHQLDPWPDVVAGLTRLKSRYIIAPLSNGNVALIVNMAKRAGLPWDLVLGAEIARHYKPQPEAYLNAVDLLGLTPENVMMVAAHNSDLVAATSCGLRTAFVARPQEYGPAQQTDLRAEHDFTVVADDFGQLADRLGC